VFGIILGNNSNYFPKQRLLIGINNEEALCFREVGAEFIKLPSVEPHFRGRPCSDK
jgi:hypothetical protein